MQDTNRGRQYTFDGFEVTKANRKAFSYQRIFPKMPIPIRQLYLAELQQAKRICSMQSKT